MFKVLAGAAALAVAAFSSTSAFADGCNRSPFQGLYIGAHGGFAIYTANQNDLDGYFGSAASWSATENGFNGGAQIGYNFRPSCNTLFGVEADWSWAGLDAITRVFPNDASAELTLTSSLNSFGTIRTRTGLVVDNLLLYVTGGIAIADAEFQTKKVGAKVGDERFSFSVTRVGWTGGVGAEWALWANVSLKSEVLYMNFGDNDHTFFSPFLKGRNVTFSTDDSLWVSRVGLNFKF